MLLQAFDLLELDGEDLRPLPFEKRKAKLSRLLARTNVGIALNEHTDADGVTVFRQACVMGLEGIVSKRLSAPAAHQCVAIPAAVFDRLAGRPIIISR